MSRRRETGTRTAPVVAAGTGVNLLPTSVHAAADVRRLRGRLVLVLVLVLAVVVGGYGFLLTLTAAAQDRVTTAEAETTRLEAERVRYDEVEEVRAEHRRALEARTVGMGPEIRWTEMLSRIDAVIAADTLVTSFAGAGPSAVDGISRTQADPLDAGGIGNIAFSIRTPTLPDTAAWLDALNGIPGFRSASFSSATLDEDDGVLSYTVTSTVQLDLAALSLAFRDVPDATTTEGAASDGTALDDTQEAAG